MVRNWFARLFAQKSSAGKAENLYSAVMARALDPDLYESGLSEDTFDGRFEAVSLHCAMVMRSLREFGKPGMALAESLYRRVFDGFDHALRERGAGDSSIARKIRGYGERFFGLARAIDAALAEEKRFEALMEVLERNGIGSGARGELAEYLMELERQCAEMPLEAFESGDISWPSIEN